MSEEETVETPADEGATGDAEQDAEGEATNEASPGEAPEKGPAKAPTATDAAPDPAGPPADEGGFSPMVAVVLVAVVAVLIYTVFPKQDQASSGDLEVLLKQGSEVARSREKGGPRKAVEIFKEAVRIAPQDPRALASLGRAYVEVNRFEDGIEKLREARKYAKKTHDIDLYLGMALTGLERYEEARTALELAVRSDPKDPQPLYYLGVGAMRLGQHKATVRYLGPFVEAVPRHLLAVRIYADALSNVGREGDAIAALTSLTRMNPGDMPTRRTLQDRRIKHAGFAAVEAEERAAAQAEGAPAEDVYLYARLLSQHPDRTADARVAFEDLQARFPNLPRSDLDLASLDLREGNLDAARERIERVLEGMPGNLEAQAMLADLELRAGRYAEARELYTKLMQGQVAPHAHLQTVATYLDQGQGDEALAFGEKILAGAPVGDPRNWPLKGEILQAVGKFAEADAVLESLTKNGRDQDLVIWQGYTAFLELERGADAEADAAFGALVSTAGVDLPPDTCLWAGVAAHATGDLLRAKTLWGQGTQGPDWGPSAVHTRACKRLRGDSDKASLLAAANLAGYRQVGDALFAEGLALEIDGKTDAARETYREARAACRQDEFPARLIDRALERVGK